MLLQRSHVPVAAHSCIRRVEPSISVKSSVTVPRGSSAIVSLKRTTHKGRLTSPAPVTRGPAGAGPLVWSSVDR
jgi:hypothetical protein